MLTKLKLTSLVLCSFLFIACSINHHPSSHANNLENRERPNVFFIYDDDNHDSERNYLEAISTFHSEHPETEVQLVDKYDEQALVDELNLTESQHWYFKILEATTYELPVQLRKKLYYIIYVVIMIAIAYINQTDRNPLS